MLDFDFSLRIEDNFIEECFNEEYMGEMTHEWYNLLS